jgi:hypothetical protein
MRAAMIVAMTALVSACGGGGESSDSSSQAASAPAPQSASPAPAAPNSGVTNAQLPSQLEIAELLYSDRQRTPAGFLQALAAPAQGYVATVHLKNVAGADLAQPLHELCTDDWNEALEWSNQAAARNADLGGLVENNTTASYFEFVRVSRTSPDAVTRQRVFRCQYVDRQGVDLREGEGYAGMLNADAVDARTLRDLSEYLWGFTTYNNFGHVVLQSAGSERTGGLEHTLTMARLTRGTQGACDDVEVFTWRHSFDLATTSVTLEVDTVSSFRARSIGAHVQTCNS